MADVSYRVCLCIAVVCGVVAFGAKPLQASIAK